MTARAVRIDWSEHTNLLSLAAISTRISVFLAGFSYAALILLLGVPNLSAFGAGLFFVLLFLIATIIFLLFEAQSFLQMTWAVRWRQVRSWYRWGSHLFALGIGSLIGSIALVLNLFTSGLDPIYYSVPYILVAAYLIGWALFYRAINSVQDRTKLEEAKMMFPRWQRFFMYVHPFVYLPPLLATSSVILLQFDLLTRLPGDPLVILLVVVALSLLMIPPLLAVQRGKKPTTMQQLLSQARRILLQAERILSGPHQKDP